MRLRDRIKAITPQRVPVEAPEWAGLEGARLSVRVLSGAERWQLEEFMAAHRGPDGKANTLLLMCRTVTLALVDESGQHVFDDEDIDWLKDHRPSGPVLIEVFGKAAKLNRMTREDQEELVKNSAAIPSASSGSASPNGSACPLPAA